MSFEAIQWAIKQGGLLEPSPGASGAAQLLVLIKLADYFNSEVGEAWPSHARMARELQLSPSTVKRSLVELEKQDLIEIERRRDPTNPRKHVNNRYTFPGYVTTPRKARRARTGVGNAPGYVPHTPAPGDKKWAVDVMDDDWSKDPAQLVDNFPWVGSR